MSRPTWRYCGSVSSVKPSQPASSPSTSIAHAAPSIRRFSRSRSGWWDSPHHLATLGSRMIAARGSRSASAIGRRVARSPRSVGGTLGRFGELVNLRQEVAHLGRLEDLVGRRLGVLAAVPEAELQAAPVTE